jgi:hypothetical protein
MIGSSVILYKYLNITFYNSIPFDLKLRVSRLKTEIYVTLEHVILPCVAPSGYVHQRHIYALDHFHGSVSSSQIWP